MAYPTNINFKGNSQTIGGQAPATAQTTQTAALGTTTRGFDATKGDRKSVV